jgi:hypothetical protein
MAHCPKASGHRGRCTSVSDFGCFPAGTLIHTPLGPLDIASAESGDLVFAFDRQRNVLHSQRVLRVCRYKRQDLWKIEFADGTRLRTTGHHCFCASGNWKKARNIETGDLLSCLNVAGNVETRRVTSSSQLSETAVVYNIIVEGNFTFVADGVIAHSFTEFRSLRTFAWRITTALARLAWHDGYWKPTASTAA